MSDRDEFAELVGSARNVTKSSSFCFTGRIRYGIKNEKFEERFLCMDTNRIFICSIKIPVKIESQFNILFIKSIEKLSDSHVIIETDEKQTHSLYALHDKGSLQPFLIILIRCLYSIMSYKLPSTIEIHPENEFEKLLRLSSEYFDTTSSDIRPCGGFSYRYECDCDFYQLPCYRNIQNLIDTVYSHRTSREFTFREFESLSQRDWLPILSALRNNEWFRKITIENIKLSSENIDELCTVTRSSKEIKDLSLNNCGLKHDFGIKFGHSLPNTSIENLDLSNNPLEDKGLTALIASLQQRKVPFNSLNLQSCSITHKSIQGLSAALVNNTNLLKNLKILNLSGNRIKDENCITILFSNNDNVLEELHLSDIEFNLESFFHSLASMSCKLRRLHIYSTKSNSPSTINGGVKTFFTKTKTLEILQLSNASLSIEFLKELSDGLHANMDLNKLDIRLGGNPLETFIHDYAARFATIPCMNSLDITGCDVDNEIPLFLTELKKNRQLKSLYLGKNFNNIKPKNIQKAIAALKDLVTESEIEYLSLVDSKLKDNTADFLQSLINNTSLRILDIRGNLMGDNGVRVLLHILQTNTNLHTIFFDRNLLTLNNFEDIVHTIEANPHVQYVPIPITDIILMKTNEKDRMEKLQLLMNKLDSLCVKNQQQKGHIPSTDDLIVRTTANLTHEMARSWDNQKQLLSDQSSLEYIQSYTNRLNSKNDEVKSILNRTLRIDQVSSKIFEIYVNEEESLLNEWNEMCKLFEEKLKEKNERLSRKFYQLFKEQTAINYDDKFQELLRTYFSNSNDNINQLLNKEIPSRLVANTRNCYINLATCLQKRAYDTMNQFSVDMHKQLETNILTGVSTVQQTVTDGQQQHGPSTLDRIVNRGAHVVQRLAHKNTHAPSDTNDETVNQRNGRLIELNDHNIDASPKTNKLPVKDHRQITTTQTKGVVPQLPISPKPSVAGNWRRSALINSNENEPFQPIITNPIYNNVPNVSRAKETEAISESEGDLIEHDLLSLVKEEQEKEQIKCTPPALPAKKRITPVSAEANLDVEIEQTTKLAHPGKDRPRRTNIRPPNKRSTNGNLNDSSSDGGLDNDDSIGDIPSISAIQQTPSDPTTTDLPPKTAAKLFKSVSRTPKATNDEHTPPPVPAKLSYNLSSSQTRPHNVQPQLHPMTSNTNIMSKSALPPNSDSPQTIESDPIQEKFSMSTSSYAALTPNKDESRDPNQSSESILSPGPPVLVRTGKAAIGTRVFPMMDSNGEMPQVRLRHCPADKKVSLTQNTTSTENRLASDNSSGVMGNSVLNEDDEQYKRLSVKERARMLTTNISPTPLNEKKSTISATSPSSTSASYTPRTHRRLLEQVNLFC